MSTIDHDRSRARHLVAELHQIAERSTGDLRDTLQEAACLLDGYQAGLSLATPHPATGYALVTSQQRAGLLDAINPAALLPDERDCCGTFPGTTHRSTCPQYRGKCKPAAIAA